MWDHLDSVLDIAILWSWRTALLLVAVLAIIAAFFVPGLAAKVACVGGGVVAFGLWFWSLYYLDLQ